MQENEVVPTLVRGSWPTGHGVGCVMQLRDWMKNGNSKDKVGATASDRVKTYNGELNSLLITLNDRFCTHGSEIIVPGARSAAYKLCSECTFWLIDLADKLDDTGDLYTGWYDLSSYVMNTNGRASDFDASQRVHELFNRVYSLCMFRSGGPNPDEEMLIKGLVDKLVSIVSEWKREHVKQPTPVLATPVQASRYFRYPPQGGIQDRPILDEILDAQQHMLDMVKYSHQAAISSESMKASLIKSTGAFKKLSEKMHLTSGS